MIDAQKIAQGYDYPLLIKHLFSSSLLTAAAQEIVSSDLRRYDYRVFRERIGRLADGLAALGVAPGETVAVMDWDCHRYLECFFAVPMMGAVLHTINIRLSPEQILYTINHAEDDVILVHADFLPILEQISGDITRPVKLVLMHDDPAGVTPPEGFASDYESLLDQADPGYVFPDFAESTIATTFYTTGTTGDPKGVYYSHRQLVLHSLGLVAAFSPVTEAVRVHKGDVYMPLTPLFHVHGWGFPYAATMLGMKQVYPGRYEPAKLLRLIESEDVTFTHCVPTILHMLLNAPEVAATDLSRLKMVIGGSALSQGLARAACDRGIRVFAAYGLSETCPFLTVADLSHCDDQPASEQSLRARSKAGKPGPLIDLRVVDEDMNDLPRDEKSTGEIVVRAPWLTMGYANDPERSEDLWRGGYLHTGDVGYIDATGSLQITDRIKDVIKSGGEWISSLVLENIASRCEGVAEVAAIGVPDARWGERPVLIVVRKPGAEPGVSADTLRAAIRGHVDSGELPKWAVPERIEFVDAIEKTSVGKLNKKVLRVRYANPKPD